MMIKRPLEDWPVSEWKRAGFPSTPSLRCRPCEAADADATIAAPSRTDAETSRTARRTATLRPRLEVEIRLIDLLRGRRGRIGAEAAVLDHHDDEEPGMVVRRPRRVPGVVVATGARLRRSGLAGDLDREAGEDAGRRSSGGVRGLVQPLLDRPRLRRELQPTDRLEAEDVPNAVPDHGLGDVRAHDGAAVHERGVRDRELERAHLERSLADREVDGLALRPRIALDLLEVRAWSRNPAGRHPGQVERRPLAEPELVG